MPNAKDALALRQRKFLMLGDTGHGKTTQLLTLPGKKFAYLFDPNALDTIKGYDVDYEEYLPDRLHLSVHSMDGKKKEETKARGATLYQEWERDFGNKLDTGFFDDYEVVAFDSATTFLDLIMDQVLSINGRFGQWPHQDDYGPQMVAFTNVVRQITALKKTIYMTGHLDIKQDDLTKKILRRPMMTGRLVAKIPLLFSDCFYCDADVDDKGQRVFRIQTVPDRMNTTIRTSIKGLDPFENVTIDWNEPVEGQGLGGILNWEQKQEVAA